MTEMKINLSLEGLDMLYRLYEKIMVRHLWEEDAVPIGSGAIWKHVNSVLPPRPDGRDAISRASVIFAANRNVDSGIWDYKDATGKGGHHRRYFAKMSEADLWTAIKETVDSKVDGILDEL